MTGDPTADGVGEGPEADPAVVRHLREFAAGHGGDAVAVVEHLGRVGARIVVVAPDGEFGDAVARSVAAAEAACRQAGIAVQDWDRDLTARITPTPADRLRMADRTH